MTNSNISVPRQRCWVIKFQYHWDNMHALLIEQCTHHLFQYACISRYSDDSGAIHIRYKDAQFLSSMMKRFNTTNIENVLYSMFPIHQGQSQFIEYGSRPIMRACRKATCEHTALYKTSLLNKRKRDTDVEPPILVVVDDIPFTPPSSPV